MASTTRTRLLATTLAATSILGGVGSRAGEGAPPEGTPSAAPRDSRRDMVTALPSLGPHPSLGAEARLFDRLIGTWDCNYSFHAADGTVSRSSGELKFGWIIDGRALQDIWIGYPKDHTKDERSIGTSVRFFDSNAGIWRVVWVAPANGLLITLQGGAEGSRIVLRGQDSDGSALRWSFNDIEADSFVWRGEKSRDGGQTWRLEEEHHMRRRNRGSE